MLVGTLVWWAATATGIDPAGTALWAVLAAGLLFSPIAWHNYLMLLWPGVLMLIALAAAAATPRPWRSPWPSIPVSWNAEWPPDGSVRRSRARSTSLILLGYWLVLSRSAVSAVPSSSVSDSSVAASEPPAVGRPPAVSPTVSPAGDRLRRGLSGPDVVEGMPPGAASGRRSPGSHRRCRRDRLTRCDRDRSALLLTGRCYVFGSATGSARLPAPLPAPALRPA